MPKKMQENSTNLKLCFLARLMIQTIFACCFVFFKNCLELFTAHVILGLNSVRRQSCPIWTKTTRDSLMERSKFLGSDFAENFIILVAVTQKDAVSRVIFLAPVNGRKEKAMRLAKEAIAVDLGRTELLLTTEIRNVALVVEELKVSVERDFCEKGETAGRIILFIVDGTEEGVTALVEIEARLAAAKRVEVVFKVVGWSIVGSIRNRDRSLRTFTNETWVLILLHD